MGLLKIAKKAPLLPADNVPFVTAVIVAAGRSVRMGTGKNKQFLQLCGVETIARTLSAFEESRYVREVVVVINRFDIGRIGEILAEYGFMKVTHVVAGGETRQQSAALGLKAVNESSEYIAVHDGARPLVTPECVDRVIETAFKTGAASAAVKVKDTLKIADENGIVQSTPDRSRLWAVQTPQVFKLDIYRDALNKAIAAGTDYTDDCQLIETAGGRVSLVEGEYTNIKITTPDDIAYAEAIIRLRGDAF